MTGDAVLDTKYARLLQLLRDLDAPKHRAHGLLVWTGMHIWRLACAP